jgi:hypothetical protein
MLEEAYSDDPQNPLHQRLFLVRPAESFFEAARIGRTHPAAKTVCILTPSLPYETFYEGWHSSWRRKAKADFIASFVEDWSGDYFPVPDEPPISHSFLDQLRDSPAPEADFDRWWTMEDVRQIVRIDPKWRPS